MKIGELIDALGGNRRVAALFGVGQTAVCNWRAQNSFPARLHLRISREAEARGIQLPPDFFETAAGAGDGSEHE